MKRKENSASFVIVERDRALINKALGGYLRGIKGPRILKRAMGYSVLTGGKRLRPLILVESARALKGDIKRALPFACAIEFIHNFSLVHDDLPAMDNDNLRRGKPTCHKKFGENIAILAGDALLNLAFGILAGLKLERARKAAALISGAIGACGMIGGQALDLKRGRKLSSRKIDSMKTAALMSVSSEVGALAAGARSEDAKRMREFGKNLGLAFQIADDIEDREADRRSLRKMRKEAMSFISRGKKCIEPLDEKADALRYIADSVSEKAGRDF
ncbi:MAG: polyprenyl synthetase family protein [Omnitrophica bacterium]|nr:polyprenyl synthetase family protein [Candidatus Omnitrophota bacterium]